MPVRAHLLSWLLILAGPAGAATFQGLGDLGGGGFVSVAIGISANGKVVVGQSESSFPEAYRWNATNGIPGARRSRRR